MNQLFKCPSCGTTVQPGKERKVRLHGQLLVNLWQIPFPLKSIITKQIKQNMNLYTISKHIVELKPQQPKKRKMYMMENLFNDSISLTRKLPNNFDVIIGLPRTGLFVADIIASIFGRPLSTPNNFIRGEVWKSRSIQSIKIKRVLVVDEIVSSGKNMSIAIQKIKTEMPSLEVYSAAVYIHKNTEAQIDYNFISYNSGTLFEWESVKENYGERND